MLICTNIMKFLIIISHPLVILLFFPFRLLPSLFPLSYSAAHLLMQIDHYLLSIMFCYLYLFYLFTFL